MRIFFIVNCMFSGNFSVSPAFHPDFQKQLRRGVLKMCSKFTGEHPCQSAISIRLLCNFIEVTLRNGCFSVNLLHIFLTPFLNITSDGLPLDFSYHHGPPPALSSNLDYFLLLVFARSFYCLSQVRIWESILYSHVFFTLHSFPTFGPGTAATCLIFIKVSLGTGSSTSKAAGIHTVVRNKSPLQLLFWITKEFANSI